VADKLNMSMAHWLDVAERVKPKYREENLSLSLSLNAQQITKGHRATYMSFSKFSRRSDGKR